MNPLTGLVILDGPDGVGKTTLGRALAKKYDGHYMHQTYRYKSRMFTYHTAALHRAVKLSATRLVIMDRLWLSEICYARVYRGNSPWPLEWRFMERVIHKVGGIHVVCLPVNAREYLGHCDDLKSARSELYSDTLPVYLEYYHWWRKMASWPHVMRYDMFHDNVDVTMALIKDAVEKRRAAQDKHILDPANYNSLGHIDSAEFLVVGDVTNQRKRLGTWWPFFDYGGSSLYLTQIFEDLNLDESKFVWANARGQPDMARYLASHYELRPICLGDVAYKHLCTKTGDWISFGKPHWLRHPAYEKRFFAKNQILKPNIAAIYNWPSNPETKEVEHLFRAPIPIDFEAMRHEHRPGASAQLANDRG